MKTIIAIDPGSSGGIAVRNNGTVFAEPMPKTEGDVLTRLREIMDESEGTYTKSVIAIVEEVGGFTGKGQPGSAMFKFGRGFGFLLGVLQTLNVRVELVRPQAWTKTLGLGTASTCASKTEWKNRLKARAQRLYPGIKVTLATADALLLLEYHAGKEGK